MMLISPAFASGAAIPSEYTCSGADISPPLSWAGLPGATKSLVLVVEDPDAPSSGTFRHWGAFDIPPALKGLPAGYGPARRASGFRELRNDFGRVGYGGPCPPSGGGTHHYHFRLLALGRASLGLAPQASILALLKAAEPYAIGRAELIGTYRR